MASCELSCCHAPITGSLDMQQSHNATPVVSDVCVQAECAMSVVGAVGVRLLPGLQKTPDRMAWVLLACHTLAVAQPQPAAHQAGWCEVPVDRTQAAVGCRGSGSSGFHTPVVWLHLALHRLHQTAGLHRCRTMEDWIGGPGSPPVHCTQTLVAAAVVSAGVAAVACMRWGPAVVCRMRSWHSPAASPGRCHCRSPVACSGQSCRSPAAPPAEPRTRKWLFFWYDAGAML